MGTMDIDMMNLHKADTEDLMRERNRLKVERSYARHCDDEEWVDSLTHKIDLIEVELNLRVDAHRA